MTKFKQLCGFAALPLLSACAGGVQHTSSPLAVVPKATAEQQALLFDQLKSLEGAWEMKGPDGKTVLASEFHVTSGGSAVREIMFAGTPHEMTNVYHMDGPELVTTHYCAAGDQPRMRAAATKPGVIAFHFESATNVTSPDQPVMGDLTLSLDGKDHLVEEWHSQAHGASKESTDKFVMTRAKTATP